ncbi:putative transcription factor interactor and regulator CCHC(Zn) family [Helianthus annuus]|uniref:Transcription factor interactor and regulator CCHC(Zn) family n=1 Tax=Helianthus annuus TaxID=4232 RepID=A0A9K3J8M4_HELAN|nr:putative transcription factor interactor and regulator CCHC(Zn) family [Helianthus annuus]KAJ0931453.1 putative transcription factor interactor and regulator CCHC(Zn) family [Helianthus annuus]
MNSPSGQQDVKMYYKGSVPVSEAERSPKIQTAFSAGDSSEKADQSSNKISSGFSSFPSVNPKETNTSFQSQSTKTGNGYIIQCNIALNLPEGQSFSEDTAKDHMALLGSVLLSYEGLVAGRIGNPMLTKEDYDQIDAEEMELMDIKWCLASVLRRAEKFKTITGRNDFLDAHVSTLGFDKSKVTCFRCREKGHFKRECKGREASGAQNPFGKDDYYRKAIYQQVGQSQEPQTAHGRKIEDPKRACLVDFSWNDYISSEATAARIIDQDDERLPEGFSWDMFVDEKGEYKAFIAKIVREPDLFATWMKSIGVNVQSENEKSVSSAENSESTDELSERSGEISDGSDESLSSSDESVIEVEKVVDQVLDTDEESESKSKSGGSKSSVNSQNSSVKRCYSKEFLLSKANLDDETFEVVYTLNGSDKLYYNKEFPIMNIKTEVINKIFKLVEVNIPELKVLNNFEKPIKYTSRIQQRLNKKKGYNSGSDFPKKPNQNRSYKKKGLGFIPPENDKNMKNSKMKSEFVSGGSSDEEQKKPFWRQSNQEFLAERKKNGVEISYLRETRTCYRCNEVGHIAWNCTRNAKEKQGVSQKLKEKVVDVEPPTEKLRMFENSKFEVGECSKKNKYEKKGKDNQVWVAKKDEVNVGDESGSTKPEEPQVEKKISVNDEEFPSLKFEEVKKKVGKTEISNQFYKEKNDFDVEKTFNGNVKKIFGKMLSGRAKGVKDFYATKKATYNPTTQELKSIKSEKTWMDVCFP